MEYYEGTQTFYAPSRKEWRQWLSKNHKLEKSVWLIMYNKDSDMPTLNQAEAIEEALCFGWIDSKAIKRDADSRLQFFAQRNPRSKWSIINRERAEKLIKRGLMRKAGRDLIELAKKSGTWEALDEAQQGIIPADLQALFKKNSKAHENFQKFPPSSKRIILEWISNAKRPETRLKRITETVELAAKNVRANHYRQ